MQRKTKSTQIYEIISNIKLDTGQPIIERIDGALIGLIVSELTAKLPKTNQELVTEFNETFRAEKEATSKVEDFKFSELRIALILEELIELSFALGYDRTKLYDLFIKLINKVYTNPPFINNGEKLQETFDAGLDLLVVTYGLFDIFNMASAVEEGMLEVHRSNMSKLCQTEEELRLTVQKYREQGITLETEKEGDSYVVKNRETQKILKPVSYEAPNLKQILIKHKII